MGFGHIGSVGRGMGRLGTGGKARTPADIAIARLPASLTAATRAKYFTAINTLASTPASAGGTLWSNMLFFHIYATDNTPNAVIDLTGNGHTATLVGNLTFLPRVGYQGDGSTTRINTNFTPSTQGGTLNNQSYGVIVSNNRTTNQAYASLGNVNTSNAFDWIVPLYTDGTAFANITNNSVNASFANAAGTKGLWIISRTVNTTVVLYKDGTQVATAAAGTVGAVASHPTLIGAGYVSNAGAIQTVSADTHAVAFASKGLSAADVTAINAALQPFVPSAMPATPAEAWGFTNTTLNWTPTSLSDLDTTLTNDPSKKWYMTQFWGVGNPSTSDVTYSAGTWVDTISVNDTWYRSRISSRGNTTSTFQGSISGNVLTVSSMLGVATSGGATGFTNPVAVGQRVAGAGMGINQPSQGSVILSQLSGTPGGVGTYQLDADFGTIGSQVFNGYSSVGQIPAFTPGGYFEFTVSFNPALIPATGFPGDIVTLQMVGLNSLFGRQFVDTTHSTKMHSAEFDLMQLIPTATAGAPTYNFYTIDEVIATDYANWSYTIGGTPTATLAQMGNPTFTSSTKIGMLWVPTTLNGGLGLVYHYINDVHVFTTDIQYLNAGGFLSFAEGDTYVLQFEGGVSVPLTVSNIKVLQ
jgi:hypothetical protein